MPNLQPLTLSFRKTHPQPILTVHRTDGTSTWMKLYPGMALHDLAHYVIETELGLDDAFYGLLARGYDIKDFEAPRDKRPEELLPKNLPTAALQVEHLVNLLLVEVQDGGEMEDLLVVFAKVCEEAGLPVMERLTDHKLKIIRNTLSSIKKRWDALASNESLELKMSFSSPI